ncbi:hypothetical protein OG455_35355 [Kitasatospora sp. NBC_01287]|uniref:hypothetical protein n=1 Tax=Kitasatospora sp. NBC_01287 TaxID=2903573 RepID=UPI00224F831E|nr:hypothetical protein [Kitasatospora sp. NBC_01287]MCX4750724.1 hypothetical protein [Kitasatospora sp. NBC_01287]
MVAEGTDRQSIIRRLIVGCPIVAWLVVACLIVSHQAVGTPIVLRLIVSDSTIYFPTIDCATA